MTAPAWPETETQTNKPNPIGDTIRSVLTLLIGLIACFCGWIGGIHQTSAALTFFLMFGFIALAGAILLLIVWVQDHRPRLLRHATAEVLGDVPKDPVPEQHLHEALRHEWVEENAGGMLRPLAGVQKAWEIRHCCFLTGFWLLLSTVFTVGLLNEPAVPRAISLVAPALVVGAIMIIMHDVTAAMIKFTWDDLITLTIPRNRGPLLLDFSVRVSKSDLSRYRSKRLQIPIPREKVIAIQLCAYFYQSFEDSSRGVQGLLVCKEPDNEGYHRHPLLTCTQIEKSAFLLAKIASHLQVPLLFHADEARFLEEEKRARERFQSKTPHSASLTPRSL